MAIVIHSYSQKSVNGIYDYETICCQCTLDLKSNSDYELDCSRHYQKRLIEKGTWSIDADTILLKSDTSETPLLVLYEDRLAYMPPKPIRLGSITRQFISRCNYHDNGNISIIKTWKYFKWEGKLRHGEWKYFDPNGTMIKTELYRKGKLRKTITEPNNR